MEYSLLNKINSPEDVKKLNNSQISLLCEEVRDCIISTVSKNGGHLASNLGAVELTVALHRSFSSPEDAIIFDVGHQCYTHKLLTGRFNQFSTIRQEGGISGFMKPNESEHDPFITGHSSNSISAAYGIYKAKKLKGEKGTAVAVIGDGAMTGGMAYEALNNAGNTKGNFIVVLNDNKMSISKNVGALSRSFTRMRNRPKYHHFKFALSKMLLKIPCVGNFLYNAFFSIKETLKNIIYKNNIFTAMGFNYLGPVDGHNIEALESLFDIAKSYSRPSLIHVITTKGKGYPYAEKMPKDYHGVSPFDVTEGAPLGSKNNFSAIAGQTLCKMAEDNPKICAITAAMTEGTGLYEFSTKFKNRFFDVGIAEQHALTFGAGLAKQGMKPYFVVYSSFLQRAYDQIVHDAATGNFPIKLLIDRAGIVGEDGQTHQGVFDVAFLSNIPRINIYSPATYKELEFRISSSAEIEEISAIRYPRGSEKECIDFDITADFNVFERNKNKVIVTYGRLFAEACDIEEASLIKLNKIYPISDDLLEKIASFNQVYFFEEGIKSGGIGEHIGSMLLQKGYKGKFVNTAIENEFVAASNVSSALKKNNLDRESMIRIISGD